MKFQLVLVTGILGFFAPPILAAEPDQRPNIVVFLADDMGWGDAGCYGHEKIKSPNLDKLASQGVRFTQAYSSSGVCSPSRSSILTGRTPYRNGVWQHLSGNGPAHLRSSEITYPTLLKKVGYQTCHVGKWHLNSKQQFNDPEFPQPNDHGYDHWMYTHNNAAPSHKNPTNFVLNGKPLGELKGYSAPLVAKEAVRWIKEDRDESKPFVLSVWTHEPHLPIASDKKFTSLYGDDPAKTYMGNITQMDFALGTIMDVLDEKGLTDNTLFIFTSDNGPEGGNGQNLKGENTRGSTGGLRGRKRSDFEGGIRVPAVVRWPAKVKPGTISEIPVIGSDIFVTVLNAAGVEEPKDRTIDGEDMTPAFTGKAIERDIPLFWRTHVSPADSRVAIRIDDFKLVANETMTEFLLFDIASDPHEKKDLSAEMPEKLSQLKKEMLSVWEGIKEEGPKEWWENSEAKPSRGRGTLAY